MSVIIFGGYALGLVLGLIAYRNTALGRVWPVIVRTQILASSVALSLVAVWRIDSLENVLWPFLIAMSFIGLTIAGFLISRPPGRAAKTVLTAWSASPNTGFWVVPVGAALAGPTGALLGVLADRIATPIYAAWIWRLRRDAPIPQRRHTSLIDQAPLIALGVGLALHLVGPAPAWTSVVTAIAVPLMAIGGAAIFIGSVLHPTQRIDPRPGVRRWLTMVAVRIALLIPIIVLAPSTPIRVVAILAALSIPAFIGPQISIVYGYAEAALAASSRYSWYFAAVGLVIAILAAR